MSTTAFASKAPISALYTLTHDGHSFVLDDEEESFHVDNCLQEATIKEFDLLDIVVRNGGKPISKHAIAKYLFGASEESDIERVDAVIRDTRRHLGVFGPCLRVVYNKGYRWDETCVGKKPTRPITESRFERGLRQYCPKHTDQMPAVPVKATRSFKAVIVAAVIFDLVSLGYVHERYGVDYDEFSKWKKQIRTSGLRGLKRPKDLGIT